MTDINTTVSRTLQTWDGSAYGDDRSLALKLFSGTVLEAFRNKTVFYDNTGSFMAHKTLSGGKSFQWPVIGDDIDVDALGTYTSAGVHTAAGGLYKGYHEPGKFISGAKVKMNERVVEVDDMLVAAIDIPFADLDISHFDIMAPFATKLGRTLAISNDKKVCTTAIHAARHDGIAGVYPGGQQVQRNVAAATPSVADAYPDTAAGATLFRDDVATLAKDFDDDNVPEDGRYLFISPYIRKILRHDVSFVTVQNAAGTDNVGGGATNGGIYNQQLGSNTWDYNTRGIGMLEGFNIVLTNHIPTGSITEYDGWDAALGAKYNLSADGSGAAAARVAAVALCGAQEGTPAVGMVQASGMQTVLQDDHRRNVKFMKAQMMVGYDFLSPWCAGVIEVY